MDETSQPLELLLSVSRDGSQTLGAQIEEQVRSAIRDGVLRAGTQVPSTRDLARQLGVSRRIAVDAYAQLAAEGYLTLRQGARPRVSESAATAEPAAAAAAVQPRPLPRYDFRPSVPDVSTFPRTAWLKSLREAVTTISDADLGYGDVIGVEALRTVLADYLGRVRGVVAEPARVVVTSGYSQGLGIVCHALAGLGAKRIAIEDPSGPEEPLIAARAGLEPVPIPVDEHGMRVDELDRAQVDAVVLTPGHQHPTGVVLAGERRTALARLAARARRDRDRGRLRRRVPLRPRRRRRAAGARAGPRRLRRHRQQDARPGAAARLAGRPVRAARRRSRQEKVLADRGTARIEQYAFADFLGRGELDRHLRRMRVRYRTRRDALLETLAHELPEASVRGIAAGLHAIVELPGSDDEQAIFEAARARRIEIETLRDYQSERPRPPADADARLRADVRAGDPGRRSASWPRRCALAGSDDLLHGPAVAVRVAEEDEAAPGEVLHLAHLDPASRQLRVRGLDVRRRPAAVPATEPGSVSMTPLPIAIEQSDPGGVSCTKRISSLTVWSWSSVEADLVARRSPARGPRPRRGRRRARVASPCPAR